MPRVKESICSEDGCEIKPIARGLCNTHYRRLYRSTKLTPILETHGMSKTPEYRIWVAMVSRTTNPNSQNYADYGGRGITICDEWRKSFVRFYADMGKRPNGTTLDRIDNNKGYSQENCRWTSQQVQSINQRMKSSNTSGIRGVIFNKNLNRWQSYITVNRKHINLGTFKSREEATSSRTEAEQQYFKPILENA